jgi:hypothetical protein
LGGDGVYDILNVINAHNEKFSASYGSGNGSSSGGGEVEDGEWASQCHWQALIINPYSSSPLNLESQVVYRRDLPGFNLVDNFVAGMVKC